MDNSTDPLEKRMLEAKETEDYFVNMFNNIHKDGTGICIKYGLDNVNFHHEDQSKLLHNIPSVLRSTPDFMVVENNQFSLVEVKGIKKNLWLKVDDLINYQKWNKNYQVYLFVVKDDMFVKISIDDLSNLINNGNYAIKELPQDNPPKKCYVIPFQDMLL